MGFDFEANEEKARQRLLEHLVRQDNLEYQHAQQIASAYKTLTDVKHSREALKLQAKPAGK